MDLLNLITGAILMFEQSSNEHALDSGAELTPSISNQRDSVYESLDSMGLIEFGKRIPIEAIRSLANIPDPDITGMSPREIRKTFQDDDLAMLGLRDYLFTKHLMHQGMAIKKQGDFWVIPEKHEMHRVWKQYATKAGNALNRARWLMRSAPATTGEDAAFAQSQAARVARQVAKLTEQAAKLVH